jgi:RNA 3'-terminal phosphate cyclase (ATP)
MRQHLTAVKASAEICGAELQGDSIGSSRLVFRPGAVRPGAYDFSVGTAGSTTLVLQTVLPPLLMADGKSSLTFEGGTHNPHAPPFDFLARAFLPLVSRLGPDITAVLERPGFYPAGGGRMSIDIHPVRSLARLELLERGEIRQRRARALVANLPRHIGERECQQLRKRTSWEEECCQVEFASDSRGPGNVFLVEVEAEHVTEVFVGFGEIGRKAEQVANQAIDELRRYLAAGVPVGEHLADQLIVPLALSAAFGEGGGTFRTLGLSRHSQTNCEIVRQFLDVRIDAAEHGRDDCVVTIERASA